MNLKERNYAGDHVVVGSLEVLGDIKGGNFAQVQRNVEQVQKQTELTLKTQDRKWEDLSADGIITPFEKQQLLKEIKNIQQSQSAIIYQARSVGLEMLPLIQDYYIPKYQALYNYLYTTLHLFDDMESNTVIENRTVFNNYFSEYYYAENYVTLGLSKGLIDLINIRVLDSLLDEGEEGNVGIYKGAIYQYVNGEWRNVSTGSYKGAKNSLPMAEQDAFFLAKEDFSVNDVLIVNDEALIVNNEPLEILRKFIGGYIYYYQDNQWFIELDKTNYRYTAAFADVIIVTGDLPQIFQDAIDNLQEQVDTLGDDLDSKASAASLEEEIALREGGWTIIDGELVQIGPKLLDIISDLNNLETDVEGKIDHLPVYFGIKDAAGVISIASQVQRGDFLVYSGTTSDELVYGEVSRWTGTAWEHLAPTVAAYGSYYMQALEEILTLFQASSGAFSSLFAQSFWTACANMNTLNVQTIYLRDTGNIQSANTQYSHENHGLLIDAAGNIDANGDTHIKGKVAIGVGLKNAQGQYYSDFNNYDTVIGGRTLIKSDTKIQGVLDGATGNFSGVVHAKGIDFVIEPGNIVLAMIEQYDTSLETYRTAYKFVAEGYYTITTQIEAYGTMTSGEIVVYVYRNNNPQFFEVARESGVSRFTRDRVYFSVNDIIKFKVFGSTSQIYGIRVSIYIQTDYDNKLLKLLSTPYQISLDE